MQCLQLKAKNSLYENMAAYAKCDIDETKCGKRNIEIDEVNEQTITTELLDETDICIYTVYSKQVGTQSDFLTQI